MRLPKIPKGLKSRISRLEKKVLAKAKVNTRKKEIEALKKKEALLKNKLK
jgi:hypothetical protein